MPMTTAMAFLNWPCTFSSLSMMPCASYALIWSQNTTASDGRMDGKLQIVTLMGVGEIQVKGVMIYELTSNLVWWRRWISSSRSQKVSGDLLHGTINIERETSFQNMPFSWSLTVVLEPLVHEHDGHGGQRRKQGSTESKGWSFDVKDRLE